MTARGNENETVHTCLIMLCYNNYVSQPDGLVGHYVCIYGSTSSFP